MNDYDFSMHRPGLPQERIVNRLSVPQMTLSDHLAEMATLPIPLNADLSNHLPSMPELAKLVNTDLLHISWGGIAVYGTGIDILISVPLSIYQYLYHSVHIAYTSHSVHELRNISTELSGVFRPMDHVLDYFEVIFSTEKDKKAKTNKARRIIDSITDEIRGPVEK